MWALLGDSGRIVGDASVGRAKIKPRDIRDVRVKFNFLLKNRQFRAIFFQISRFLLISPVPVELKTSDRCHLIGLIISFPKLPERFL